MEQRARLILDPLATRISVVVWAHAYCKLMSAESEPLFCIVVGSGMVGSACAASVAALGRGAVAMVGPRSQKSSVPPYSSHDDYSRVVSVLTSNIGGAPGVRDLALESQ